MTTETQDQNRTRILDAAEQLLKELGRDVITVRAVADAAGVQLPTIYRLFVDKVGLLDAVAERGFVRYMEIDPSPDGSRNPVELLRHGWDIHVRFGLENPGLYSLMFGEASLRKLTPATRIAMKGLDGLIDTVAAAGLLTVGKEEAVMTAFASASGVVLAVQFLPPAGRRADYMVKIREAMIAAITGKSPAAPDSLIANAASTLSGNLDKLDKLSAAERTLLGEWLNRLG